MPNQLHPDHHYAIIPRCLVFLRHENSILLLKGSPQKKLWANLYNGIGGHIERGEDVYTAAYRELFEETGLIPDHLYLCGIIIVDSSDFTGIGIFVFTGYSSRIETIPSDEGSLVWVDKEDVFEFNLVDDLYELLPRVLKWKPNDPPFSAAYEWSYPGNKLKIRFFNRSVTSGESLPDQSSDRSSK